MNIEKEVERKPQSRILLKINLGAEQTTSSYQETLERYQKETQIPGFRRGKVPETVIKRKFGRRILEESAAALMNQSLEHVWKEEKELAPLMNSELKVDSKKEFVPAEGFSFAVEYDVMPSVEIPRLEEFSVEKPLLQIEEEKYLEDRLKEIQQNNALVSESEEEVTDSSRVSLDAVNENGEEQSIVTILAMSNDDEINDDLLAKKVHDKIILTLEKSQSLASKLGFQHSSQITLTVTKIECYELPKLNDEFAQDIDDSFETLDDLKKDIISSFKKQQDSLLRSYQLRQFYRAWLGQSNFELPHLMEEIAERRAAESLLEPGLAQRELQQKLQSRLEDQDEALHARKAKVVEQTKIEILRGSLVKAQGISVSSTELRKEFEGILANRWQRDYEDMFSLVGAERIHSMEEQVKESLVAEKLDDYLLSSITVVEGKKMSIDELEKELRQR